MTTINNRVAGPVRSPFIDCIIELYGQNKQTVKFLTVRSVKRYYLPKIQRRARFFYAAKGCSYSPGFTPRCFAANNVTKQLQKCLIIVIILLRMVTDLHATHSDSLRQINVILEIIIKLLTKQKDNQ